MKIIRSQKVYNFLICLILVSFGFFGSLSHIFSLALIMFAIANYVLSEQKIKIDFRAKIVYVALSGCFFLFLISGIFHSNFSLVIESLSPMLPLPFIGMLIIFHKEVHFNLSSERLSKFSKFSILFSLVIYLFFTIFMDSNSIYQIHKNNRVSLFSGNPIPFSFVMLGLSVFCLSDWRNSTSKNRFITLLFFFIGTYFAAVLSGSRGTLLSLALVSPIIIFYLTNSFKFSIFIIFILILTSLLLFNISSIYKLESNYLSHIIRGLDTIILLKNIDSSVFQRLEMWSASINAFQNAPIFGYGITERFNTLKPYFHQFNFEFTHPHNDTFAGFIASGLMGGITAFVSIISAFLAALFAPQKNREKKILGIIISVSALITANISTVFFNDISCAWLAFSTYLIWITDFKSRQSPPTDSNQ